MAKGGFARPNLQCVGLVWTMLALAGCASMPNSTPSSAEPPPPPPSSEASGSSSPSGAEAPESQAEQSGQAESAEAASGSAEAEASGSQGEVQAKSNEAGAESNDASGAGAETAGAETEAAAAQPSGGASGDEAASASTSAEDQVPSGGQPGEVPGSVSAAGAETGQGGGVQGDDALARLEAELEGSLQSFDQTLLDDRVALQTKIETGEGSAGSGATESGAGQSGGGWAPLDGQGPNGVDGGFGGEESQAGEGDQPIQSTGADGGLATTHRADGKTTRPPDIPPGNDDDIVARQLREAAERETDPELREKLWEEYRVYKLNQSRAGDGAGT